jgi:hypothetical protein
MYDVPDGAALAIGFMADICFSLRRRALCCFVVSFFGGCAG